MPNADATSTDNLSAAPALVALPGILDARIRTVRISPAEGTEGTDRPTMRIAYLAGPGAEAPFPDGLAEALELDARVAVGRLGPDGLDDPALYATLPVWGPEGPAAGQIDGGSGVQVAGTLPVTAAGSLAKSLLCPHPPAGGAGAPAQGTAETTPVDGDRDSLGNALSDRPALAEGPPLVWPADLPLTLAAALARAAKTDRGVRYLTEDGSDPHETYAALTTRALAVLGGLHAAGAAAGDILLIDASDPASFLGAFWACQLGGLVPTPIIVPPSAGDAAALHRLQAARELLGNPLVVAAPAVAATYPGDDDGAAGLTVLDARALESAPPTTARPAEDPDATAVIILTSGSTGLPKGVHQSHRATLSMVAAACLEPLACSEADIFLNWMPLDHVGGAVFQMIAPTALACEQIHGLTGPVLADPLRWVTLVDRYRVTLNWAPNFAFGMIADALAETADKPWDLSCLRALVNGGEAVTEGSLNDFLDGLAPCAIPRTVMRPAFGMSETCAPITMATLGHARGPFASLGGPVPGSALRIIGDTGETLREGEIGRLLVRGPQIFRGYHDRPDLTAEVMRDGWFDTGDMGFLADGQLYLTGRLKDSIIVNGAKFFAHEIEGVTARVPGIDRAGVAAVPVRPAGVDTDKVAVFFSTPLSAGGAEDDVLRTLLVALRNRLARDLGLAADYLLPVSPADIPRTGIGKIMRPTLRAGFESGAFDSVVERVTALVGGAGTCPVRLHEKVWHPRPLPPPPPGHALSPIRAVFTPTLTAAFGDAVQVVPADVTGQDEAGLWRLAPTDRAGHEALLTALSAGPEQGRPDTLVHLWGCGYPGADDTDAYRSLLCLGQAVAALPEEQRPACILVVTRAAAASLLPGLVRSLALGLPDVRWRLLGMDVAREDATVPTALVATIAERVRQEQAAGAEPEVTWRDGLRLAARFRPVALSPLPAASEPPVQPGALWLVTGGLGGIGALAAEHLLDRGATVLLTGRTACDALSADKADRLGRLSERGAVRYRAVDVGDAGALAAAVAEAEAEHGGGLAGLLHLAGVGPVVTLQDDDAASLPALRRAALDGLEALAGLLATRPAARMAVAATITGRVGGRVPGYAAVGAAALDRAAEMIAAGLPLSTLAFSSWRDVGMSAGRTTEALLRTDGLLGLEPDAGLAVLEGALWRPGSQWIVGLDDSHPLHAAQTLDTPTPLTRPVIWQERGEAGATDGAERLPDLLGRPGWVLVHGVESLPRRADGTPDLARLTAAAGEIGRPIPPRDETERRVAMIFGEVLSVDPPAINENFFAIGGGSLLAGRLAARLSKRFFLELPVAAIFRNPTVEELTRMLRQLESKPGLVDAVAAKLAVIDGMSAEERNRTRHGGAAPADAPVPQ